MRRTQIQLEESQYEALREFAHRERISMSEAVRRLLAERLTANKEEPKPKRSGAEALLSVAGKYRSGYKDIGRRHDEYLAEDFDT